VISLSLRAHIRNEKLKTQSRKANKLGINFPSLSHERLLDVSEVFYHPLGMQSTCARGVSLIADTHAAPRSPTMSWIIGNVPSQFPRRYAS
jgi:hypothetical protein